MTAMAAVKYESPESTLDRIKGRRSVDEVPAHAVRCTGKDCAAYILGKSKASSRRLARDSGWKMRKEGKQGEKLELWRCGSCEDKAYKAEEQRLAEAVAAVRSSQSRFERWFGEVLDANQIGAATRLRHAMQTVEIGGNARMAYEPGAGINSLTFESKTISDAVVEASNFIRRCQREVISQVQMRHHDAWACLKAAVSQDMTPQETGTWISVTRKDRKNRDAARLLAIDIIDQATKAILHTRY